MKYIYGPVKSRRLGLSLGISLTPYKVCTFDCIYCQLGKTTEKTLERKEYVDIEEVFAELKNWFAYNPETAAALNYITFSGSGEALLHSKFGLLISRIKGFTSMPIAVITNGCLLSLPEVRKDLLPVDLVVPSLNAVTEEAFERIDRPSPGITVEAVVDGLIAFRREYRGKLWLEVMLVKGVNDDLKQVRKLKEVIDTIEPDKVQLNSPVRTTAEPDVNPVEREKLEKILTILDRDCEIV